MAGPRILLIIGGGIAAYKSCELVRLIRKGGGKVTCVLTDGGAQFVTPMALAALSENPVHTTLWDLRNEVEMGHIQLSREADLIVVCPATANMLAKMAAGMLAAVKGRPVAEDVIAAVAERLEDAMRARGTEVTSSEIGHAVLDELRELDEVAYMRFASVYKNFDDAADFRRELALLHKHANSARA